MTTPAPMGIIAAAGEIPRHIAEVVVATGQPVFIVALKDIATADFSGFRRQRSGLVVSRIFWRP